MTTSSLRTTRVDHPTTAAGDGHLHQGGLDGVPWFHAGEPAHPVLWPTDDDARITHCPGHGWELQTWDHQFGWTVLYRIPAEPPVVALSDGTTIELDPGRTYVARHQRPADGAAACGIEFGLRPIAAS